MTTTTTRPIGWQSAIIHAAHPTASGITVLFTLLSGPKTGVGFAHIFDPGSEEFARLLHALNIAPQAASANAAECAQAMQGQLVCAFVRGHKRYPDDETPLPVLRGIRALHPNAISAATAAYQAIRSGAYKSDATPEKAGVPLPSATPFAWDDPSTLDRRDWIYGKTLLRGALTVTVGQGGSGKSILGITETVALASGRNLLGVQPGRPMRVWYINLEETKAELKLRFTATLQAFKLWDKDCADRLLVDGNETQLCIARSARDGTVMDEDMVNAISDQVLLYDIDVIVIDPFVSSHAVNENDNMAMDAVAKQWAQIAAETQCAVHLIHHVRKSDGDEITVADARGASALINKARIARELNPMTRHQAEEAGIEGQQGQYFFVRAGKANYSAQNDTKEWYQVRSYTLPNGEDVGVVAAWEWPDTRLDLDTHQMDAVRGAIAGQRCRRDYQAHAYVGRAIAEALGIDTADKQSMRGIKSLIARWTKDGALVEMKGLTDKREEKIFVEVGNWSKAVCRT